MVDGSSRPAADRRSARGDAGWRRGRVAGTGWPICWKTTASTGTWCTRCGPGDRLRAPKNDKVDAAIDEPLLRATCAASITPAASGSSARSSGTDQPGPPRPEPAQPDHAVAADHGYDRSASYWTGPGRGWLAELDLPPHHGRSSPTAWRSSTPGAVTDRIDSGCTPDAKADRQPGAATLPGVGSSPRWSCWPDRRHQPVRQRPQAGQLGRADPDGPRLGPDRPARAHLPARLGLAAWVLNQAAQRQAVPGVRRHLLEHRQTPREEDRHHRDRPQATGPRLPPAGGHAGHRRQRAATAAVKTEGRQPRARSLLRHSGASAALDLLTEQPGPGHMVMAAARTLARRRMGACETTPPASLREPRTRPLTSQPQTSPSSPSRISRRLPASSSFVLAAARLRALQLDPGRAAGDRAAARKIQKNSQPAGGARRHRARFVRPLDTGGPYGCR